MRISEEGNGEKLLTPRNVRTHKNLTSMTLQERYNHVIDYFETTMPAPQTELSFESTFQLLVAVVLSAQCTDRRVNLVTPALFARYPDAPSMARATQEDLLTYIRSVSYPNSKAQHLSDLSRQLVERYGSEVPSTFDELVTLPGVGRKTANVVLAIAFEKNCMPVDTHVFRVANRLGLAQASTPLATERTLVRHITPSLLPKAHHWLLMHGRYVCVARKPKCDSCGLKSYCRYYQKLSLGNDL